eukprot:TRINITY_DN4266_c0_g1_i1.p1 TRINITY_DN4266_c0_g1~~TRINITY_DN4266_c0_g1_i1.p1  ORF type:complete len:356 (+),score=44.74 TRINITY_DN4266_c0_g1_i1:110-1177(+)
MDLTKFTQEQIELIPGIDPIGLNLITGKSERYETYSKEKIAYEAQHLIACVLLIVAFFAARFFVQRFFLEPFARFLNIKSSKTIRRFKETGWYAVYYPCVFVFGLYVFYLESIGYGHGVASPSSHWSVFPTTSYWQGWPAQPITNVFRFYYLLELTFYVHCMIAITIETKQKDFYEMALHHLATFSLVFMSYWVRYLRVGLMILLTHNVSDIFLYNGKCFHYIANSVQPGTKLRLLLDTITNTLFVIFMLVFFFSRLVFFPIYLVRSAYVESYAIIPNLPYWHQTNAFLCVLVVLHCFWFYLILNMFKKVLSKNTIENDIRSDSEDEDEKDNPDITNKRKKRDNLPNGAEKKKHK